MKTFSTLSNLFTNLSNNQSNANYNLGRQLISDQHRYLLQMYFDNERTYQTVTIGAEQIRLNGGRRPGATEAQLGRNWPNATVTQKVVFSNGEQREVNFSKDYDRISWEIGLKNADNGIYAAAVGVQAYSIPPQVSKIKNDTITIGQLQYTPAPIQSIQEWTQLNALPYASDIPNYFFIYQNKVHFWPIPSSSGNIITFNYKSRVPDLTFDDYVHGWVRNASKGTYYITGNGTDWDQRFPLNTDLLFQNLFLSLNPPNGDGLWYQIDTFFTPSQLAITQPLQANTPGDNIFYTIGQLPLLQEDFHDMLVYGALKIYFSSIVKDKDKYAQYNDLYQSRLTLLERYAANKSVNVDLGAVPMQNNPNLYIYAS